MLEPNSADPEVPVTQCHRVGRGRPGADIPLLTGEAVSPAATICAQIVQQQRTRVFCIKQQSRADRSIESFIARLLGFHTGLTEAERKKIFGLAAKIRKAGEGGGEDQRGVDAPYSNVLAATRPMIIASATGRHAWDGLRDQTEKTMRKLSRQLPVWPWAEEVRGLSDLGLAVIIGEAGRDLVEFRGPACLWKRLGLAVLDGRRQGNPGSGATADEWVRHGYNRTRRAQVWAFVDDVLLRAQWRSEKDGVAAHAIGPYGQHYNKKKADYLARDWTLGHADKAARRYMTKALIKDLYNAWWQAAAETGAEQ